MQMHLDTGVVQMKQFDYIIKDQNGIHAVPACKLAMEARNYKSDIRIARGDRTADMSDIIEVMGLNAKQGDQITVFVEGPDEEETCELLKTMFLQVL